MAINLGAPDKPPLRRVVKPKRVRVPKGYKPKKPKQPKKIVYRTPAQPRRTSTTPMVPRVSSPVPNAAPPVAPPDPYARWREFAPWAIQGAEQIKADQAAHQTYVTDKVMPWLSTSLNLLNAYNTDAQNNMLGGIQGAGGAYGVSAAMTPLNVSSNAPGGAVVGPNSYLTEAGKDFALGSGHVATALANSQAALNKMQPTTLSQGYINAMADRAAGLPLIYTKRLNDYNMQIEQFIGEAQAAAQEAQMEQARWEAEFTEDARHNRVGEAISATNAQTNAAIQFGRLGLSASDQAFDNQPEPPDPRVGAAPPPGYFRDVDGRLVRIPSSGASGGSGAGTSTRDAQGRLRNPTSQGFVGGWKVKPKKLPAWAKGGFTQGADGKWYVKRGSTPSGSTPKAPENLRQELDKWYFSKVDGKYDPPAATRRVGNWILSRKKRFTRKDGTVNFDAIASLLVGVIGGSTVPAGVRDFLAPYVVNGRWK
jgi:hypothetical protein